MARTKQEVRNFLNKQVGQKVNAKCGIYNGQCPSLVKALLEYLGVPKPYAARGNAKDMGDTLVNQNIAERGRGWLTVAVNRSMGGGYGHIWLDLKGEANFEQNGARALRTTKNTRPINQAQQLVSLDKWIKGAPAPKPAGRKYVTVKSGWGLSSVAKAAGMRDWFLPTAWSRIAKLNGSSNWRTFNAKLKPGQKVRVK